MHKRKLVNYYCPACLNLVVTGKADKKLQLGRFINVNTGEYRLYDIPKNMLVLKNIIEKDGGHSFLTEIKIGEPIAEVVSEEYEKLETEYIIK